MKTSLPLLKLKIKPKVKNLLIKNKYLPQGVRIKNKSHLAKLYHKQALQDLAQGNKQALKLKLKEVHLEKGNHHL